MVTASILQRPPILATGQVLDDRYRIRGILAEGGMGTVFVAEHVLIGRRMAIKVLHRELAHDAKMVKRFMNEALAAGTLGHPNIVEATDMGFTPDRVPYIVYEYLEGSLLTEEVYRINGLPVRRALRIAIQIASALDAAHNAGIVHLDLKSDNVFLTDKAGALDHVKVLDFGISRFMEADTEITQRGLVIGTPEFMAPEQVTSPDTVDKRADIYALGVLLYEMIAGRRPFAGDDPRILLYRICNEPPPPLDREVAPELESLLFERLLAKDRQHRFSSMKDVIAALEGMLQIVRTGDALAALASAETREDDDAEIELPVRSSGILWAVLAVLVGLGGAGLYLVADQISASTNGIARVALEADAEHIATLLTTQARAVRTRVDGIAASPFVRTAVETAPAKIPALVRDSALFAPEPGEVLELYLTRDGTQTSVLRQPDTARAIPPGSGIGIESRADGTWVVAYAQVANTKTSGIGGTVAIATPVDFTAIERQIGEDAVDATLLGLGSPVQLASSQSVHGTQMTIPLRPLAELDTRSLTLQATIAPVTRGGTFRRWGYACFGIAGLCLLGSLAARRRRVVLEEL